MVNITMVDNQRVIVRQNALAHADAVYGKFFEYPHDIATKEANKKIEDEYFEFARRCEEWALRDERIDIEAEMLKVSRPPY